MWKIHRKLSAAIVSSLALILIGGNARADDAKKPIDFVHNGGFEEEGLWSFIPSGADASGKVVENVAHSGQHSYLMTSKTGFAPNVYARIVQLQTGLRPY